MASNRMVPPVVISTVLSLLLPWHAFAALPAKGSLVKASGPAVYWYGQDGKRYVFPNAKTYASWFADFSNITTVSDSTLAGVAIGGNITYRPGVRMLKVQSDPSVYVTSGGATLRKINSETTARALYGTSWNTKIDDIPDVFFADYHLGVPVESVADFSVTAATAAVATIDVELSKRDASYPSQGVTVVKEGLQVPWDVAFLPDGDMLITERPGTLRRIGAHPATITVDGVHHFGEGGLMAVELHPQFATNKLLYLYFTAADTTKENRLVRYKLNDNNTLTQDKVIIDHIPSGIYHDGGGLAFGPNGMLYLTTGDSTDANLSQNRDSLAGKTLRVTPDGDIPTDNPFGTRVWSWGHRNAQGIAWDNKGQMWQTEHGRSGALSGMDELNLIQKGANYGWPTIEGDKTQTGMTAPVRHSGASVTWAPAGIAYADGSLFFTGLRGEAIYEAVLDTNGNVTGSIKTHLKGTYGRLRALVKGADGYLYFTTSNRDGRGTPKAGDDKLLKATPAYIRAN